MSVDGVWTGEIYSPYGWENSGVYVLDQGRILRGNNRHYSTGMYSVSGSTYKAEIVVYYYGPPRVIFGEIEQQFEIVVTGELGDGVIDAEIVRRDSKPQFAVQYRMTRRLGLPEK